MLGSLNLHIDAQLPQGYYKVQHTLDLNEGVIGLYGGSGQGKTTLLKIIAGLIEVNPNALTWSNSAYQHPSPEQKCTVYQAQTPYLFAHLSVIQNLQVVLKHSAHQSLFNLDEVIKWCAIESLLEQPVVTLSGGEQQRVAFARSLLCGKPVILLDEPFSAVDVSMRQRLLSLVLHLQKSTPLRFIMVSHALSELAFICHEIIELSAGKIIRVGPPHEHIARMNHTPESAKFSHTVAHTVNNDQQDNCCPFSYLTLQQPQYLPEYQLIKWQLNAEIDIYSHAMNEANTPHTTQELPEQYLWLLSCTEVTLTYEQQKKSSILNQIPVTIIDIVLSPTYVMVHLNVAEHSILVQITRLAYENLMSEAEAKTESQQAKKSSLEQGQGLSVGAEIWAQLPLCSISAGLK